MSEPAGRGALVDVGLDVHTMGGRLRLQVACAADEVDEARRDLRLVARRVERWVARLTRFEPGSELSALNADPEAPVTEVGPTLASVLAWAIEAGRRTGGTVDVALLDARLAAETGVDATRVGTHAWRLRRAVSPGRHGEVLREGHVRFDLDGIAKGWIADRALTRLGRYPAALVDADGDIAMAVDARTGWAVGIADPSRPGTDLVTVAPELVGPTRLGIATSGIDVHRWGEGTGRHHLIDPMTGRPAVSDLRQCTVVAASAALAEAVAKAVVIRGSGPAADLVGRAGVSGAVLLGRTGEVLVTEGIAAWLA